MPQPMPYAVIAVRAKDRRAALAMTKAEARDDEAQESVHVNTPQAALLAGF